MSKTKKNINYKNATILTILNELNVIQGRARVKVHGHIQ